MARTGIQLCYPFETSRLEKWAPPYIIQPKLDGERCRALRLSQGYILLSSEENIITSVPHINVALDQWAILREYKNLPPVNELDAELYHHGWTFEEIHSVIGRTTNRHAHYEMMQLHVFDVVNFDPQLKRLYEVKNLNFSINSPLREVDFRIAASLDDLMESYRYFIDEGYEGIIVRHHAANYVRRRSTFVMKFKPKKDDEYEIVDLVEAVDKYGKPKAMLGAIICRSNDGTLFKAGAGQLDHTERTAYWKDRPNWQGKTIRVGYQNLTETNGVPRFGICIELMPKPWHEPVSDFFNPLLQK
jgi:ATP-dependent DNA ligase